MNLHQPSEKTEIQNGAQVVLDELWRITLKMTISTSRKSTGLDL